MSKTEEAFVIIIPMPTCEKLLRLITINTSIITVFFHSRFVSIILNRN